MTAITIPTLSTQRLTLRGFTAADLDALAPSTSIPKSAATLATAPPLTTRPRGGRWLACWATGSSAAMACGPLLNEQPAG
jgi:hypothetical protein